MRLTSTSMKAGSNFGNGSVVLLPGSNFTSVGGSFTYEVVGACCRLFDREQLPYPHCSLQWKGKSPSWRRVGRRFVPDMATLRSPSYVVKIVGSTGEPFETTLYWTRLSPADRVWWNGTKDRTKIIHTESSKAA